MLACYMSQGGRLPIVDISLVVLTLIATSVRRATWSAARVAASTPHRPSTGEGIASGQHIEPRTSTGRAPQACCVELDQTELVFELHEDDLEDDGVEGHGVSVECQTDELGGLCCSKECQTDDFYEPGFAREEYDELDVPRFSKNQVEAFVQMTVDRCKADLDNELADMAAQRGALKHREEMLQQAERVCNLQDQWPHEQIGKFNDMFDNGLQTGMLQHPERWVRWRAPRPMFSTIATFWTPPSTGRLRTTLSASAPLFQPIGSRREETYVVSGDRAIVVSS